MILVHNNNYMYLYKCQQCSMNYVLPPKLLWGRLVGVQEQAECISALFLWESGLLSTSYYAVALQLLWQPCRIHFSSVNHKPTKITDANIEKYDPIHVCYHVSKRKQRCMELGGQPPLPIFGPRTTIRAWGSLLTCT